MKRKSTLILVVIVLAALFLTACGEKKFTQADVNATLTAAANGEEVKASTPTPTLSVEEQVEATVAVMMEEAKAEPTTTQEPIVLETATLEATAQPEAITRPEEAVASGSYWSVYSAPESVTIPDGQLAEKATAEEMANRASDQTLNSLGLNTESFIADAGTYLTFNQEDADSNPSAWMVSPDTQYILHYAGPAWSNLAEGGSWWATASYVSVDAGLCSFDAQAKDGHVWFVVLTNPAWDHKIDTDLNIPVEISNYDPGFIQINRFPPGSFLSQAYFLDNVASAHVQKTSGSDGSSQVSAYFCNTNTGATTIINQAAPEADWTLVYSNIK